MQPNSPKQIPDAFDKPKFLSSYEILSYYGLYIFVAEGKSVKQQIHTSKQLHVEFTNENAFDDFVLTARQKATNIIAKNIYEVVIEYADGFKEHLTYEQLKKIIF